MCITTQVTGCKLKSFHIFPTREQVCKCKFVSITKLWKLRDQENQECLSELCVQCLQDTGQYDVVAKHSRFELDFSDVQTFAGYRECVGFFLESPMLDEEMKKMFEKSIG